MSGRRRRIQMPARFDPSRWEIAPAIGIRELVLITLALVSGVWLLFVVSSIPFWLRLTLTGLIALTLIGIALVPISDKPVEHAIFKFFRYKLRSPGRVYRNARMRRFGEVPTAPPPRPVTASPPHAWPRLRWPSFEGAFAIQLAGVLADPGLILATFVCLLVIGSTLIYGSHGGGLPQLQVH